MSRKLAQLVKIAAAIFMAVCFAGAHAQTAGISAAESPPLFQSPAVGNVDAKTGHFTTVQIDLSIGSSGSLSQLTLGRAYDSKDQLQLKDFGVGFANTLRAYALCAVCDKPAAYGALPWTTVDVVLDGNLVRFTRDAAGNYSSVSGDGSTLVSTQPFSTQPSRLTFRDRQGGTVIFDYKDKFICGGNVGSSPTVGSYAQQHCYYARYREAADGEFTWYTYEQIRKAQGVVLFNRLTSVYNSRGYGVRFTYLDPSTGDGFVADRYRVAKAEGFRKACTPVAGVVSCSSGIFATVNYFYLKKTGIVNQFGDQGDYFVLDRVTDSVGGTTSFGYDVQLRLLWSKGPKNLAVNNFTNTYMGNYTTSKVSQQVGATGVVTTYTYNTSDTTVSVGSAGAIRKYGFSGTNLQPDWIEDYGRRTSFAYDSFGRTIRVTPPEGDANNGYSEMSYDSRGNVIEMRRKPKAGFGGDLIVTSATFPGCSDTTQRTCKQAE